MAGIFLMQSDAIFVKKTLDFAIQKKCFSNIEGNLSSVQPLQNSNKSSEIHWNFFDAQGTNLIRQKKEVEKLF